MLEARLQEAALLKRLLDSIKELVTDANFECNEEGLNLQAMDNSHVALVAVKLEAAGFQRYRCDRPMPLGVNLNSLTKVLKCAKDDDICVIKATDDADVLNLVYEARNSDRIAEYDMKLMDIDSENLGIPDTEYDARVTMASSEFSRIVRDLSQLGESVRIEISKEGVRFSSDGEAANGNVLLKQTDAAREKYADYDKDEEEEVKDEAEAVDDEGGSKKKVKKEKEVKKEVTEDVEMDGDDDEENEVEGVKPKADGDGEEEENEDEDGKPKKKRKAPAKADDDDGEEEQDSDDDEAPKKKRKKDPTKNDRPAKKAKKGEDGGPDGGVRIEMNSHVTLTFSLKYLVNFSKSSSLSDTVQLRLSNDVPLLVSYKFGQGHIRYYLAPKIGDD